MTTESTTPKAPEPILFDNPETTLMLEALAFYRSSLNTAHSPKAHRLEALEQKLAPTVRLSLQGTVDAFLADLYKRHAELFPDAEAPIQARIFNADTVFPTFRFSWYWNGTPADEYGTPADEWGDNELDITFQAAAFVPWISLALSNAKVNLLHPETLDRGELLEELQSHAVFGKYALELAEKYFGSGQKFTPDPNVIFLSPPPTS